MAPFSSEANVLFKPRKPYLSQRVLLVVVGRMEKTRVPPPPPPPPPPTPTPIPILPPSPTAAAAAAVPSSSPPPYGIVLFAF
uniref:Uncharacterized protein n=1 Tax=Vespula pensylvanica TaxID=30213 RepID=A0A834JKN1_VESPE|nr:hypothetical protein H0235_017730 [Vespula pensylvanica]